MSFSSSKAGALICTILFCMSSDPVRAAPLQVFILAGQSNMEGHAKTETFDYIGDDPKTAWLLKKMKNPDGSPYVCKSVWISYFTGIGDNNGEGHGKLTTGYGSRRNPSEDGGKIGPEYMFGIAMEEALDAPILIIKTAWGGKSLFYDYRPPSAGIYPRTEQDIEKGRNTAEKSGHYYRLMIQHVKDILKNPKQACPSFSEQDGYEISGFVWFQGFNDLVNRNVYPVLPKDSSENRFQLYGELLSTFIQDVRNDLNAPKMPFVIGVLGVNGFDANPDNLQFRMAMAAPTAVPKFQGNVMAVETAPFWDVQLAAIQSKREKVKQMAYLLRTENPREANRDGTMTKEQQREYLEEYEEKLISPEERALLQRGASNAGYHYLGCAKTFALMGHAFADAMQIMIDQ